MSLPRYRGELLIISRKWPPSLGGIETASVQIVDALKTVYNIKLVRPQRYSGGGVFRKIVCAGLFIMRGTFSILQRRGRARPLFVTDTLLFPLVVVHAWTHPSASRYVYLHGLDLVYGMNSGIVPRAYTVFLRWLLRRTRLVTSFFCNSTYVQQLAVEIGFPRPIVTRFAAEDENVYENKMCDDIPDVFRQESNHRILFVGRRVERKGVHWFAQEVLPRIDPPARLFVVGPTSDPRVEQVLQQSERVTDLGPLPNHVKSRLMALADLVVVPNIALRENIDVEGFGIVALEASSLGAVVVAARHQGLIDAIEDDATGFLIPVGDSESWVTKISAVLALSRRERSELGREFGRRARRIYSRDAFRANLLSGMREVWE